MVENEGKEDSVVFERSWSDAESPAMAVVETVSAITGRDPTAIPPLHEAVDSDALNALLRGGENVRVTFSYASTLVEITSDGTVQVESGDIEPVTRINSE